MTMRKWIPALLTVIAFGLSFALYAQLPDRMAIHWGLGGEPNGWSGRIGGAFGVPVMMLAFTLMFRVLPEADVLTDNYDKFSPSYDLIAIAISALCFAIHLAVLAMARGYRVPIDRLAGVAMGAFFIAIGNVLPRVKANSWIGIRTPWSVSDDANWARTHRIAGYLMVASGVMWLALAAAPGVWMQRVAIASVVVAVLASYVSSVASES
jgi:uncharacterized membrane protein